MCEHAGVRAGVFLKWPHVYYINISVHYLDVSLYVYMCVLIYVHVCVCVCVCVCIFWKNLHIYYLDKEHITIHISVMFKQPGRHHNIYWRSSIKDRFVSRKWDLKSKSPSGIWLRTFASKLVECVFLNRAEIDRNGIWILKYSPSYVPVRDKG